MRLLHVVGARPQFVKYFALQSAIGRAHGQGASITSELVHTGQHYDYMMSKVFFDQLGLRPPAHHLEVGSGSHGAQTAAALERLEQVLTSGRPDAIVVYGDTNSTLAAALAASKLHIPVAHIEAGLRSRNKRMPEEINRILTDHVSTVLFCPSETAVENLRLEGIATRRETGAASPDSPEVVVSGDVMYDVVLESLPIAERTSTILAALGVAARQYAVLTMHRAETTDDAEALARIVTFVNEQTADLPQVIFPMHPRMRKVYASAPVRLDPRVRIVEPLGYFDFLHLLRHAARLFTDSGGLQKEAYWLRVPCVTLREETEWVETVAEGWNTLYRAAETPRPRSAQPNAYGEGDAGDRIVRALLAAPWARAGMATGVASLSHGVSDRHASTHHSRG